MAAKGGKVIACHKVEEWKEKLATANKTKKLIVIDFTATWCPPCRFITPFFSNLAEKHVDVVFFMVDVKELNSVAQEFEVKAMPTFIFMKEGKIVDRAVGPKMEEILAKLEKHTEESKMALEGGESKMALEGGKLIVCHKVEEWKEKLKTANKSKKLIVIDFTSTWSPPCRFIAPVFADLAKKHFDVVFFMVDVKELNSVAQEFEVERVPTFVYMKEGKIVDRVVAPKMEEILAKLNKHRAYS